MDITEQIIDLENSSLTGRLRLRQVLLDNEQDLPSYSVGLLSNDTKNRVLVKLPKTGPRSWGSCSSKSFTISLEDFITKYKKSDEIRNLAFYKKSGEDWTKEEQINIQRFIGGADVYTTQKHVLHRKYLFDDTGVSIDIAYFLWSSQKKERNFSNCTQIAYEDCFPTAKPEIKEQVISSSIEPTQLNKENTMSNTTKQEIKKAITEMVCESTESTKGTNTKKPKTDFQLRKPFSFIKYDEHGAYVGIEYFKKVSKRNEAEAGYLADAKSGARTVPHDAGRTGKREPTKVVKA